MSNAHGAKHTLGFKAQAVPGAPETTVLVFPATESIQVSANPKSIERKTHIGTGKRLPSRKGTISPSGKATMEASASQPHFWSWLLGHVDTTQPAAGTDPTVYLHTITQAAGGPTLLTVEADRVYDKCKQGDAKLSKMKLSCVPGEVATLEVEWLALSHADGATLTSEPTFVTDVLTCRSVSVLVGGQDLLVDACDIEYDAAIEALPVLADDDGAPHVIRPKGIPTVTGSLKFIDHETGEVTKMADATTFSIVVELLGETISNAYKKFLRVTLPACQYTDGLNPEVGNEVITGDANFEAFYDTTTATLIKVEAQNTLSSLADDEETMLP